MNELVRLRTDEVADLITTMLSHYGAPPRHCAEVADNLVGADRRGIHTHGTARVPMYVTALERGFIDPTATPVLEHDAAAASCWSGEYSFGQVAMGTLVDHACDRADAVGAHIAVVHGSNHFGYAGHWVRRAADRGLAAMAFTSGGPLVIPTGGVRAELGTNPLAFGIRSADDEFMLDMSTSAVAMGKLELADRADEAIPTGWAVDGTGQTLIDPSSLLTGQLTGAAGGLVPVGGTGTQTGGHKGYGLGMLVEILCTVLSGGTDMRIGRDIPERFSGHVSHCVITIAPKHMAGVGATQAALDRLLGSLRASPPFDPEAPVQVPGDPERGWEAQAGPDHVMLESAVWDDLQHSVAQLQSTPTGNSTTRPDGSQQGDPR